MGRFLLLDRTGAAFLIADALSKTDAELYGLRKHVARFARVKDLDADQAKLEKAFQNFGMTEAQAKIAADTREGLPTVKVPYQAPDPRCMPAPKKHLTAAQAAARFAQLQEQARAGFLIELKEESNVNSKMKEAFKRQYLREGKSEAEAEKLAEIAADVPLASGRGLAEKLGRLDAEADAQKGKRAK